ncbi:helix-turn-helix transcriptional regulator [Lysinibacillus sphaericus]|nr:MULTISPECIES: helix-turn-helix transcriptional regulator [Lysinibacillus]EWH32060.1 transcriptional regulator [Lysinibacillus sphaericus CBAM5]MBE5084610.1 helix-turn-helix transcriptional regulator [Bacillus thuringiensis]AMO32501.1 hypothetical protein AR327_08695 [Lysinibacillus sphaericus]AMR92398.1 hypothetical protein A1T07_20515 [Lysinibacillus sphaericus]ANA46447.1 hypothetical protein A2J09_13185 [Lysinibacillus sphaericus]
MIAETFGEVISNARKEKKLTLREAAKRIGISHPYLSQLEKNKNKNPSFEILYKIAYELDVSFGYLNLLADIDTGFTVDSFNASQLQLIKDLKNESLKCKNYNELLEMYSSYFETEDSKSGGEYLFNFFVTTEEIKNNIKNQLLSMALKDLKNYEPNWMPEGHQTSVVSGKNDDEKVFMNPLVKEFEESGGDITHKITFALPAYQSSTEDGITRTQYIPFEKAEETFFDIEKLLNLNSELLNFRGRKLTNEEKQRLIKSIELITLLNNDED